MGIKLTKHLLKQLARPKAKDQLIDLEQLDLDEFDEEYFDEYCDGVLEESWLVSPN